MNIIVTLNLLGHLVWRTISSQCSLLGGLMSKTIYNKYKVHLVVRVISDIIAITIIENSILTHDF